MKKRSQSPDSRSPPAFRPWLSGALLTFVLVTLLALLAAPFLVQYRIDDLREERTEVIQPARDRVSELHTSLAVKMSALRGFAIIEEEGFLARYEQAREDAHEAIAALDPLARELRPEVADHLQRIERLTERWNQEVTDAGILELRAVPEAYEDRVSAEHVLYEELLEEIRLLREDLLEQAEQNRAEIGDAERFELIVTLILVPLALVAAGVLVWIGRTLRILAHNAERGRAAAERAGEAKAKMVRGLTHDLRNPLTVLDLSARRLAREGGHEGAQGALARRILRSVASLEQTIDDLIAAARHEAGEITLREHSVDLAELARGAAEDYRPFAEASGIELSEESDADATAVDTDPVRVREILRNLLINALKYTPSGGLVSVAVTRRPRARPEPSPGWIALCVRDTGPGIPPADLQTIFDEFTRTDETREGLGLGLAISRKVAEILGGELTVASEEGEGSEFTVWLPTRRDP